MGRQRRPLGIVQERRRTTVIPTVPRLCRLLSTENFICDPDDIEPRPAERICRRQRNFIFDISSIQGFACVSEPPAFVTNRHFS